MKKQFTLTIATLIASMMLFGVIGCSSDESNSDGDKVIAEVLDTVNKTVSEEIAKVIVDELDLQPNEETSLETAPDNNLQSYTDFIIQNGKLYAVGDNNLLVYNFKTKVEQNHAVEDNLHTVVYHDGAVYAGGETLYKLNDTNLEFVDDQFDGTINELYSYGTQLMIGTSEGLYRKGVFGKDKLMDDITVSAITEDNSGLWIGSMGEGLYRWDGENFQKRFLRRDTSIFDFVNTIDFKHDHLYLGCDNGLYIYNGGAWKTLTTEDGLPDNNVRTIDASDWTVYIGTNKGVVGYFEKQLTPVNLLDSKQVNSLKVKGRKLLAATEFEGIIEKNGNILKTLIQPVQLEKLQILSLIP